jgi:hypothetical protein
MNIQLNSTYIKAKIVHSCIIKYTPDIIVIKKAFWPWQADETESKDNWTLVMKYEAEDGLVHTYSSKCVDRAILQKEFELIKPQIANQDNEYADRLLENAIINGGTK